MTEEVRKVKQTVVCFKLSNSCSSSVVLKFGSSSTAYLDPPKYTHFFTIFTCLDRGFILYLNKQQIKVLAISNQLESK